MRMKSHEGELVREISKLQAMVLELRAGFSRALLELNQIQLGDTELQSQLEETRHGCSKRALHLETLVLSLREELEEVRWQIRQMCSDQIKADQAYSSTGAAPSDSSAGCSGVKDAGNSVNGISDANRGVAAPPLCSVGGDLLLHCYLQGLWAGNSSDGDTVSSQVSGRRDEPQSCSLQGRRQRVALSLLRSEWEYVSNLGQLYDKYKTPFKTDNHAKLHKAFARHVDQMLQRHLLFRNSMEERLTVDKQSWAVGDAFLKLTGNDNSAFCDAYLGYMASLATVLSMEFSQEQPDKLQNTQEEQKEHFKLLTLLLAPISRIHTYLNTVQLLLSCSGSGHSDYRSLQESEHVLRNLCMCCHMTLKRSGQWGEKADPVISRCEVVSSNCGRSAFTKYRANPRAGTDYHANSRAGAAECYAPISVPSNGHERGPCQLAVPKPVLPTNGILRNSRERLCELQTPGGWSEDCVWDCQGAECHPIPLCMPTTHRQQQLLLNTGSSAVAVDVRGAAAQNQNSLSGLAERLCGSPGPDGRVCRSDLYSLPQRIDEGDTDADLGDASVFDYSSVTTCSPDNTLELRGGRGGGESREDDDDEDDDEEDSEIPVLLKPSYTPSIMSTSQREGSVCTRWQIPRTAPLPPEVGGAASGTMRRSTKAPRRMPTGAFRPIWDAPNKQGDTTPGKESTVTFSTTNQIINPQRQTKPSRSVYRSVCSGNPVGAQTEEGIWNESEDSEGPCSTV
ncbi:rho guanine nucleotide exchange factor 33 isoform X2 [Electrophorus electricus]|uniref:rho guanine nucleotide exchange factor 33 isoform X2 n=1 Tax=Electrophorus electricus TaxID=8005 RepID=UPI0015CFBE06|nr:rho guanine nucleotide exchange factor 33 isoform X2 [Electrophorus electricus]